MNFGRDGFAVEIENREPEEITHIEESKLVGSWTFFGKSSFDLGDLTVLFGGSYIHGKARMNHFTDETPHGFYGDNNILGFDLTLKHYFGSHRYISIQAEYLRKEMDGDRYMLETDHHHEHGEEEEEDDHHIDEAYDEHDDHEDHGDHEEHGAYVVEAGAFKKIQSGFYSEFLFRWSKRWRTGVRYGQLLKNEIVPEGVTTDLTQSQTLSRWSFMLEFSPTEFSRIRLQYNRNGYKFDEGILKKYNELILNFNFAIGAHGAHPF